MLLLSSKKEAFGLDISDISIKVMYLKKRGKKMFPFAWDDIKIPQDAIEKDVIINQDKIVQTIMSIFAVSQGRRIKTRKVIASIPESKSFIRIIKMPDMEEEELKKAVFWEVEQHIPLDIKDVYLDSKALDKDFLQSAEKKIQKEKKSSPDKKEDKETGEVKPEEFTEQKEGEERNVLIIASPKKTVDILTETLIKSGLTPIITELESAATSRALIPEKDLDSYLILDLDSLRTSFIAVSKGMPLFTANIPIAGNNLTQAICEKLGIEFEEAEKFKREIGLEKKDREDIFNALSSPLEQLSQEIEKLLNFYQSSDKSQKPIEKVLLCGGTAKLKGIDSFLSWRLKKDVFLGNPWINVYKDQTSQVPPISKEDSLSFATVIGLALRGVELD